MKPIILITSCAHQLAKQDECRRTWLREWGHLVEYRFVLSGRTAHLPACADEIFLDVDDTYYGLPEKVQASHKWALEQGYDWIFKTDCDMYVHIPRLLANLAVLAPIADYIGNFYWTFALGGSYWLSKQASELLVRTPLPPYGVDGGDDVWVGKTMSAPNNLIFYRPEPRYVMGVGQELDWHTFISLHTSGPPKISMEGVHRKVLGLDWWDSCVK